MNSFLSTLPHGSRTTGDDTVSRCSAFPSLLLPLRNRSLIVAILILMLPSEARVCPSPMTIHGVVNNLFLKLGFLHPSGIDRREIATCDEERYLLTISASYLSRLFPKAMFRKPSSDYRYFLQTVLFLISSIWHKHNISKISPKMTYSS